ncbi:hypothetical protein Drose_37970 [Dactylosporangium roseum]|uniref:Polynucleotide kinase-phosphatase ligase domain-containing protein n=1 Tax=Dactylosporangium roseum TaxID=47989 RepID=A0ABY5Z3W3_9ACTN|nr:hypothetical protein Drose_37970 [Dactylosporangium roseum]
MPLVEAAGPWAHVALHPAVLQPVPVRGGHHCHTPTVRPEKPAVPAKEPRLRDLGRKRGLALRERGLGVAALDPLAESAAAGRVHQPVFAVLACESKPVDPRL